MPADLHLFSTPGVDGDIRYIIEASRPYLEHRDDPLVAYLPLASLYAERWQEQTSEFFRGLAKVETVNTELMTGPEIEKVLRTPRWCSCPAATPSCSTIGCTSAG
jgi:hypothetical protein